MVRGHEATPLVVGDTMYLVTPFPNLLFALDLKQPGGATKWVYRPDPDPAAFGLPTEDDGSRDDPLMGQNIISGTTYEFDFDAMRAASALLITGMRLAAAKR